MRLLPMAGLLCYTAVAQAPSTLSARIAALCVEKVTAPGVEYKSDPTANAAGIKSCVASIASANATLSAIVSLNNGVPDYGSSIGGVVITVNIGGSRVTYTDRGLDDKFDRVNIPLDGKNNFFERTKVDAESIREIDGNYRVALNEITAAYAKRLR